MTTPMAIIDVREIVPDIRAQRVFGTFDGLRPGTLLEVVADDDPVALHQQFERERSGQFDWQVVERGPVVWRVRIGKREAALPHGATRH